MTSSHSLLHQICPEIEKIWPKDQEIYALGIEGSANKVGVGIVHYDPVNETYDIIANVRKTYITPAGQGFLPRETAWHHQQHIVPLVREALSQAGIEASKISCICYTKGKGINRSLSPFFPRLTIK